MMMPEPRVVSFGPVPPDSMTTRPGRTAAYTPTPSGGSALSPLTALVTFWSAILPTSALLTDGFDDARRAIQLRVLTISTTTTPRLTHVRRRQRLERGGGLASFSAETPADTSVGVPPYLIVTQRTAAIERKDLARARPAWVIRGFCRRSVGDCKGACASRQGLHWSTEKVEGC